MNYSELQIACEQRKMQIKEVANALNMSYTGLRDALNKDTLSIKKLLPLCQLLQISPNEFVKWNGASAHTYNATQVGMLNNQNVGTGGLELLKEQLKIKDTQIEKLLSLLDK